MKAFLAEAVWLGARFKAPVPDFEGVVIPAPHPTTALKSREITWELVLGIFKK